MCNNTNPEGLKTFDAEAAFKMLSHKYQKLSAILTRYFDETSNPEKVRTLDTIKQDAAATITRIMGGIEVTEGEFPECCLVGTRNFNGSIRWFCTGVLVHPRVVLTAGHCFTPSGSFVVALNTINQNFGTNTELIDVKKAIPHPGYVQTRKFNDVSVLVLGTPALTAPVPFAQTGEINNAIETKLVGFGFENAAASIGFGIKREVDVPITSIRRNAGDNLDAEETRFGYESDLEFVAGGNGFDSCNGDSGGPAYIHVNGIRKLAGLTSRATAGAQAFCGEGGVYTRVDANMDFIQSLIP